MKILKYVCFSGLIAAILLGMIYFALAYVGASTAPGNFKDGTDILTYNSLRVFRSFGNIVFGMTVILACLTTCIGLVNACATFTKKHVPKFSYKIFALIFSIIGFLFTTLGLEMILKIAVPLLTLPYIPCRLHLYSYHLLTCLAHSDSVGPIDSQLLLH